jgi:hypothetical protein
MDGLFRGAGLEVTLTKPDSFNIVRESLTRIGVAAVNANILYQSAHILHKQGRYSVVHFKEMFALDGKPSTITLNDYERRNTIAKLLEQWGLVKIIETGELACAPLSQIKIISYRDKKDWQLQAKYQIGAKNSATASNRQYNDQAVP